MSKRRAFLKSGALASVGTSILPPSVSFTELYAGRRSNSSTGNPKKVLVAGAGIAGLCCAYELMKRGHEVKVLEASGRHGGHVFTRRDALSDGLYADLGAEHITKPGYEKFWEYTKEFNLEVLPYPRRKNILRRIDDKFYSEEMLLDSTVLKQFGFNQREIAYIQQHTFPELRRLFLQPYLEKFTDEYQPFGVGFDHMDNTPVTELYKTEGASQAALRFLGGDQTSALYALWKSAILKLRGVAEYPVDVYRLKGGNQGLPNAFARALGEKVKLNCPILSIEHGDSGVSVLYRQFGEVKKESADFLANCIPPPAFRKISLDPPLPAEKQNALNNVRYDSYSRLVFQASSAFWKDDGLSINMQLGHPQIGSVWQVADEIDTHRVALMGVAPAGGNPLRALEAFKAMYPGKTVPVEQALIKDWSKDLHAPTCERLDFPLNTLNQFWPHVMTPFKCIHFAGASCDNLNWGMEAATRSANRVAEEIDQS
jgi:monoamine oxidase